MLSFWFALSLPGPSSPDKATGTEGVAAWVAHARAPVATASSVRSLGSTNIGATANAFSQRGWLLDARHGVRGGGSAGLGLKPARRCHRDAGTGSIVVVLLRRSARDLARWQLHATKNDAQRSRNRRAMARSQTRSRLSSKMRSASTAAVNQSWRANSASSWLGPQPE